MQAICTDAETGRTIGINASPVRRRNMLMGNNNARNHKDNVFCMLYRDKKNLLSLYNAVNGTHYTNEEELKVVTLEYAFCVRIKNDTAFIIAASMSLYEQQSSVNPNIPLRNLYYVAEEYKKIVPMAKIYGRTQIKIPAPKFVVFYNGTEKQPAERFFRLSDMYEDNQEHEENREHEDNQEHENNQEKPELELTVRQININMGYNDELLKKCESLKGYMTFVNKVRNKTADGIAVADAVTQAVDECVDEGVLAEFFSEHRSEVVAMGEYEFDEQAYEQVIREEGREEGRLIQLFELVDEGILTDEYAAAKAGMSIEEFVSRREAATTLA